MSAERFWSNVITSTADTCWIWQGGVKPSGYGRMYFQGKVVSAHRVSYFLATGKDPGALSVCHSCDDRLCVNPNHLWLGTAADNHADMVRKGRASRRRAA